MQGTAVLTVSNWKHHIESRIIFISRNVLVTHVPLTAGLERKIGRNEPKNLRD